MFKLKRGGEETVVYTEASYGRHLEAGWELDSSEEKKEVAEPIEGEQKKRGPKPKNKEAD